MMRFFIYSRKSVQTGKGESIENQIEMCRQYIAAKFPNACDADITVYEDEGFSAKNTDRPQFQNMLRDIKAKNPDYVVCYRLDRISRNVSDFSVLIEDLNKRNISFVCIKEEFDTSKPMGKAMMYIASVFAQLERETIAERVRDNMLMLARTGRWLGGTTPTGYTSEKVQEIILDGKVRTACKLKDEPKELRAVDMMFEKYLEMQSLAGVRKYLIQQGITSRQGKGYSLAGIKQILQNPVYCIADAAALNYFRAHDADVCFDEADCSDKLGLLAYNKRDYKQKHAPRQSVDKWIIAIGKHRGRIPGEKWVRVQTIMENNVPTGQKPSRVRNDYSLLSGLITCGHCGGYMFAKHRTGKGAITGQFDYICSNKLRAGASLCQCKNLKGNETDELVYENLAPYMQIDGGVCMLLARLKRELSKQAAIDPAAMLEAQIRKASGELNNLVRTLAQERISEAFAKRIDARAEELEREILELRREQERYDEQIAIERAMGSEMRTTALLSLKTYYNELSVYERRAVTKLLVQRIMWDGSELHVYMDGG